MKAWQLVIAGPIDFGPDVADGFPDVTELHVSRAQDKMMHGEIRSAVCIGRHIPDVHDLQSILDLLGKVFDVLAIRRGQQDGLYSCPQSSDQFLLDSANRQYLAAKGYLALSRGFVLIPIRQRT